VIKLEKKESIYFLTMDAEENRWNTTFVREIAKALDVIEKDEGPGALITASTNQKFFSNGLDLEWMQAPENYPEGGDREVVRRRIYVLNGAVYNIANSNCMRHQWAFLWCGLYVCSIS
jgi:enoyl-CoA hydratase/carnithine racemase